jgi:hypothetical protein
MASTRELGAKVISVSTRLDISTTADVKFFWLLLARSLGRFDFVTGPSSVTRHPDDETVIQHSSGAGAKDGYLKASDADHTVNIWQMIQTKQHHALLRELGLHTMEGVKLFEGTMVERSPGRRDVLKFEVSRIGGLTTTFFLKRHWKVNRVQSLLTFPKRFRIESLASREWDNARRLQRAGFKTASLVAYGDECGPFGEKFSFLLTEQAAGSCSLEEFFLNCRQPSIRQRVFDSLASEVRRLHSLGLSLPDLFARHVFFFPEAECLSFCFIDVARLDTAHRLSLPQRAKCLAALNVSAPTGLVSAAERVRFLRQYAGSGDLEISSFIRKRSERLLRRRRYNKLQLPGDNYPSVPLEIFAQTPHV